MGVAARTEALPLLLVAPFRLGTLHLFAPVSASAFRHVLTSPPSLFCPSCLLGSGLTQVSCTLPCRRVLRVPLGTI